METSQSNNLGRGTGVMIAFFMGLVGTLVLLAGFQSGPMAALSMAIAIAYPIALLAGLSLVAWGISRLADQATMRETRPQRA